MRRWRRARAPGGAPVFLLRVCGVAEAPARVYEAAGPNSSRDPAFPRTQHREIGQPGADRLGVPLAHDAGDLADVAQVVRYPGGEVLLQGDDPELGMAAAAREIRRREPQRPEARETVGPE